MKRDDAHQVISLSVMLCVPVQQSPDQSKGVRVPGWKVHSERLEEGDSAQWDDDKV